MQVSGSRPPAAAGWVAAAHSGQRQRMESLQISIQAGAKAQSGEGLGVWGCRSMLRFHEAASQESGFLSLMKLI